VRLAPGERLGSVRGVAEDLAVALSGKVRILAPIPGTSLVGVEVQNEKPASVGLRASVKALKGRLPVSLGVDTAGNPRSMDLASTPHLLVAGQTGSGKSVFLNSLIVSLIYSKTPDEVKLVLVDPKRVEMSAYKGMPHLLRPVVTDPEGAVEALEGLVDEMEDRYSRLEAKGARNIEGFGPGMPYIVCVVDEMADLMDAAGKRLTDLVVRLAQKSRAVGIHLVLATQRPDVKVLNGRIKANIPARIAFQVVSQTDSRVILDEGGAERLAGRGDMLVRTTGDPERFHGAWVSDSEIAAVAAWAKGAHNG
jgi:S-DNA-T family DNA segregation ATPase FtsK/SpoIIIE